MRRLIQTTLLFGLVIAAIMLPRPARSEYLCLTGTDNDFYTHTLNIETGQISTSHPLGNGTRDAYFSVEFPSADQKKILFYWPSLYGGRYGAQLAAVVDTQTRQKYFLNIASPDFVMHGWSFDNKYLALSNRNGGTTNILHIFDSNTGQPIFSRQWQTYSSRSWASWGAGQWSPNKQAFAYLSTPDGIAGQITIVTLEGLSEQTTVILPKFADFMGTYEGLTLLWSPDNEHIAIHNWQDKIGIYNIRQRRFMLLSDHAHLDPYPGESIDIGWSANGSMLFYENVVSEDRYELEVYDVSTELSRTLVRKYVAHIQSFSPDNRYIILARPNVDNTFTYTLFDTTIQTERILTTDAASRALVLWPDDNQRVVLDFSNAVFWSNYDGSEAHEIFGNKRLIFRKINDWIAYASPVGDSEYAGALNLRTGENHQLREGYRERFNVDVSPNGKFIMLSFLQEKDVDVLKFKLTTVDESWAKTITIPAGVLSMSWLAWSPDTEKLAIMKKVSANGGKLSIYLYNADGTLTRSFEDLPERMYVDHWSNCPSD